ncbi:endonuclease NucS domain-containing protein [Caulobacter sp. UNC279MFTsu5.1]|uniref:endonuclease NucS domain-containing protein n=1 Tax=Caulobacter sp. UNC279MFTsu5.1 TaxID=1502775 RepID=UPI0008DF8CFA|nr:endonuclease NucS domain-containing protein [Caulobacter sp. UNC279MFTsu5.1]SFI55038.1 Protein of unknown function DUF91 [Caulobacter sp. UNC279MFTsu5.1]
MSMQPPVLGLFQTEAELRDYVAERLETLEPGLTLTKIEYELPNPSGAGGRIDIVALDQFDHVVVIELKRSDRSARSTLNELAKYVSLLINEARIPKEAIRCIVLSTEWHELRLPFSFFAATAGVHVEGLRPIRVANGVAYENVDLLPISDQPQLSPEVSLYQYPSADRRDSHLKAIEERAARTPFIRLAILKLDAMSPETAPYQAIACLWRLRLGDEEQLTKITGEPIGHLAPYAFPGWEAETDALMWLADESYPDDCFSTAEAMRGTPEKIANLELVCVPAGLVRFGDWPKVDVLNTESRILKQLKATSGQAATPRSNRYRFRRTLTKRIAPSWRGGVAAFLKFIGFAPSWVEAVEVYLAQPHDPRAVFHFQASDARNPFYLIYQAHFHPEASGSSFEIGVTIDGQPVGGLAGFWGWDQVTHPDNAGADIVRSYGSIEWAKWSCFSAVDDERHEQALYDLGFRPCVQTFTIDAAGAWTWALLTGPAGPPIGHFIDANPGYVDQVVSIFSDTPIGPPGTRRESD